MAAQGLCDSRPGMKRAFQKDADFLIDVRRAIDSRSRAIWWLGQSGFLAVQNGRGIVFDPYLSDSLTRKYAGTDKPHTRLTERIVDPGELALLGVFDLITSSHNHTDHLDAETLTALLQNNPHARFAIPKANRDFVLERIGREFEPLLVELDAGTSAQVGEITIHGVASAHPTVERDTEGHCRYLGYVVNWSGLTIYHSGDTLLHPGLISSLSRFKIELALLPINGDRPERRVAGNLDGAQAAELAKNIRAKLVVPCHFDMFEFNTASPSQFVAECRRLGQDFHVLANGERLDLW
jgi:L-ascorbate metabolism protein UlaG (beta-lactamase superfamily)